MDVELYPEPGADDPAAAAALEALAREQLGSEPVPAGLTSPWQRAALRDAMRDEVGPELPPARAVVPPPRHRA